ncbi:SCO family protein [bacterium]|nr:MAG: SCO family protein [bacterium]
MTRDARIKAGLTAAVAATVLAAAGGLLASRARGSLKPVTGPVAFSAPTVSSADLKGRPYVADFVFTRCGGPCPLLSANMARLQKRLPAAVRLVSFTVDPENDTDAVLAAYAARHGAEPGRWLFARLAPRELYELVNAGFHLPVYIDPKAAPANRSIHTTKLVLVDGAGRVRGYYDGLAEGSLDELVRDALRLLKEGAPSSEKENV